MYLKVKIIYTAYNGWSKYTISDQKLVEGNRSLFPLIWVGSKMNGKMQSKSIFKGMFKCRALEFWHQLQIEQSIATAKCFYYSRTEPRVWNQYDPTPPRFMLQKMYK